MNKIITPNVVLVVFFIISLFTAGVIVFSDKEDGPKVVNDIYENKEEIQTCLNKRYWNPQELYFQDAICENCTESNRTPYYDNNGQCIWEYDVIEVVEGSTQYAIENTDSEWQARAKNSTTSVPLSSLLTEELYRIGATFEIW